MFKYVFLHLHDHFLVSCGCFTLLVLVAIKMHETKKLLVQETTSWSDKKGELINCFFKGSANLSTLGLIFFNVCVLIINFFATSAHNFICGKLGSTDPSLLMAQISSARIE